MADLSGEAAQAADTQLIPGRAFGDLAPMISSCYNGVVYYAHGADEVKPPRSKVQLGPRAADMLGADPLTTILMWLAFILIAAIAALCVDLWLWPGNARTVIQASTTREPTLSTTGPPAWSTSGPSPTPSPSPESGLAPIASPTPAPGASPTPYLLPTQGPLPTTAPNRVGIRIRIPAIGVDRSIIEVPLTYDSRSGSWTRDYGQLLPRGRPDLVGHLAESASPGQPGNTILVGHNYGYGVNAVFLRLGQLRVDHRVEIVNRSGQTFNYRVTEVVSIPWSKKDQQELLRHQAYLSTEGSERLTLVTCGGSSWAPFPQRVYVVAVPVH
jgi:LPXTG-site transpeptidase (sortase) family protein